MNENAPKNNTRLKMADIAALAGVSISTVSRALADNKDIAVELRAKVKAIAAEHGYVVNHAARNLRMQSTQTIGIVLPMGHETGQHINDPFLLEFLGHLSEEVIQRRYDVLISKVPEPQPNWLINLVRSQRFDGLLVIGQSDQHEALNALAPSYLQLIVWGEKLADQKYCSVGVDNTFAGHLAARHVLECGSRAPLYLGPVDVPEVRSRYKGFGMALAEAGIRGQKENLVATSFTYESAYEVVSALIKSRRKFDGLVCASDVIAHAAMTSLQDAGISIPDKVNVIGFDDVSLARSLHPSLTTISQDIKFGAQFMVKLLFERIEGNISSSVVMPARLVVRNSTRPNGKS